MPQPPKKENALKSSDPRYQRLQSQLKAGLLMLIFLFFLGTNWYHWQEGWGWVDAAFMTIITLSTVGFGETHPLSLSSRLFTMGLIVTGLVIIGYIVNHFTEALIQGYFQEQLRLKRQIQVLEKLENHYILCGFGRMGRQIALEFAAEKLAFVVIDSDGDRIEQAAHLGYTYIQGDATLDEVLIQAKIESSICVVSALRSDAENLYTILSAKSLNPKIRAITRASTEEAVQKLQRAGADAVVSPYITGARRLAAAALRPQVMDFVDGILTGTDKSFFLEEFRIERGICPLIGQTLSEARLRLQSGALVLAVRRQDGALIPGPTGDTVICDGDQLICMGTAEQLRSLNQILAPMTPQGLRLPKQKGI